MRAEGIKLQTRPWFLLNLNKDEICTAETYIQGNVGNIETPCEKEEGNCAKTLLLR